MFRQRIDARRYLLSGLVLLGIAAICGCHSSSEIIQKRLNGICDTRLSHALRNNITATGGIDIWSRVQQLQADAIMTYYGLDGGKTLINQKYRIIPRKRLGVEVVSYEPGGMIREQRKLNGKIRIHRQDGKNIVRKGDITTYGAEVKLFMTGMAVTGCMAALLQPNLDISYLGKENKGGVIYDQIAIKGRLLVPAGSAKTYRGETLLLWINEDTSLIEQMWLKYENPEHKGQFRYLIVRLSGFNRISNGLKLPQIVEFIPSDIYRQSSGKTLMSLEFKGWDVAVSLPKRPV